MKHITERQLFDLYNDTLQKCGIYLINEDKSVIEYNIYEDFDVGVHSFLHPDSLQRLHINGLISLEKLNLSELLRNKLVQVQNSDEWDIANFKTSQKWREIMALSDRIKAL